MQTQSITLTQSQARRFLLAYHGLLQPRSLEGKQGILDFLHKAGCIQFDPVNIVGGNPELVLQARVKDYRPSLLEELLYRDRLLVDGWDKVASIILMEDWPHFTRHRERMRRERAYPAGRVPEDVMEDLLTAVRQRGPLSSIDLEKNGQMSGFWGVPVRIERAGLESLNGMGYLGIHHRTGTRRYFDLIERLVPTAILSAPDPHPSLEDFQEWHVLRRIGSMGLACNSGVEHWLGIQAVQSVRRAEIIKALLQQGKILEAAVEKVPGKKYYLRAEDAPLIENTVQEQPLEAAILGPLDNLMWDRAKLRDIFGFGYIWEVYKPAHLRTYGHYTLPILAGERFVARFEPSFNKKQKRFTITNWWWEVGIHPNSNMQQALVRCFTDFCAYLGAPGVEIDQALMQSAGLDFLSTVHPS